MQVIVKYLSQFLLIPLIEKLVVAFKEYLNERKKLKEVNQRNEEVKQEVDRYENSSPNDAYDNYP